MNRLDLRIIDLVHSHSVAQFTLEIQCLQTNHSILDLIYSCNRIVDFYKTQDAFVQFFEVLRLYFVELISFSSTVNALKKVADVS